MVQIFAADFDRSQPQVVQELARDLERVLLQHGVLGELVKQPHSLVRADWRGEQAKEKNRGLFHSCIKA